MFLVNSMLYETLLRAMEQVRISIDQDNPEVAIMVLGNDNKPDEILGEIGAVMTLDDGRIGLVPSMDSKCGNERVDPPQRSGFLDQMQHDV